MRFFFDRCVPFTLARMIREYEGSHDHQIFHHDEGRRFRRDTPDDEWIKALAEDGRPRWIILSGDGRILTNRINRQALLDAKLSFFCLSHQWMNMKFHDQAWRFVKAWAGIVKAANPDSCSVYEQSAGASLHLIRKS
jgi:hypothetical protein